MDVRGDRKNLLDACNTATRGAPAFPSFVSDGTTGRDVILQRALPLAVLQKSPDFLVESVETMPVHAATQRGWLASRDLPGSPFTTAQDDVHRLDQRSQ
jgi:hypothetical protein